MSKASRIVRVGSGSWKRAIATVLAVAAVASSPSVSQAAAVCGGQISQVLSYHDGAIMVLSTWRGDYTQLCNVREAWKGVGTSTCWTWYGQISASITEGKPVNVFYDGLLANECPTMPTYSLSPAPAYVSLRLQ